MHTKKLPWKTKRSLELISLSHFFAWFLKSIFLILLYYLTKFRDVLHSMETKIYSIRRIFKNTKNFYCLKFKSILKENFKPNQNSRNSCDEIISSEFSGYEFPFLPKIDSFLSIYNGVFYGTFKNFQWKTSFKEHLLMVASSFKPMP